MDLESVDDRLESAKSRHFLRVPVLNEDQQLRLIADYDRWCRGANEPAVVVREGAPASLVVDLGPTRRRITAESQTGLKDLLKHVSDSHAIVIAGPAGGRTDSLLPDADLDQVAEQAVSWLSSVDESQLVQRYVSEPPPAKLKPVRENQTWLERVGDTLEEFLEAYILYRFR